MVEENFLFGVFMQKQASSSPDDSPRVEIDQNKTEKEKTALEVKEEEDAKELEEAKKESKANASKYAAMQANLVAAQARRFVYIVPFIICAILLLILIATKGGGWIQNGTQFFLNKLRGG